MSKQDQEFPPLNWQELSPKEYSFFDRAGRVLTVSAIIGFSVLSPVVSHAGDSENTHPQFSPKMVELADSAQISQGIIENDTVVMYGICATNYLTCDNYMWEICSKGYTFCEANYEW